MPKSRGAGPHPQDATAACGAAGLPAVAGGKDCLRQTAALAASRQQRPTANSETLTSPACCRTSRRLMLLSVVKEKAFQTTILRPTPHRLPFMGGGALFTRTPTP